MNPWDQRALGRAAIGSFGALLIGALLVRATTGAGVSDVALGVRGVRLLPLVPFSACVGAAVSLGTVKLRAEARALELLGRNPWRTLLVVCVGAALPALTIACMIQSTATVDVAGFYPSPVRAEAYVAMPDGRFRSDSLGIVVGRDGSLERSQRLTPATDIPVAHSAEGRLAAAATLALSSLALGLLTSIALMRASRTSESRRWLLPVSALAGLLAMSGWIFVCGGAAAGKQLSVIWMPLGPALLLVALPLASALRWFVNTSPKVKRALVSGRRQAGCPSAGS